MATATLPSHHPATQGFHPFAHRPAKYRFNDLPKPNVYDESHIGHPTNQVEADAWRFYPPKLTETGTGLQPEIPIPNTSDHFLDESIPSSPVIPIGHISPPRHGNTARSLHNLSPRQSIRDSQPSVTPTPPPRPIQPFTRIAEPFELNLMERPQSASSNASSVVSALGPARPGGEAARQDLAQGLRERRFRDLVTGDFCCTRCQTYISSVRVHDFFAFMRQRKWFSFLISHVHKATHRERCFISCAPVVQLYIAEDVRSPSGAAVIAMQGTTATSKDAARSTAFHGISDETILDESQRRAFLDYVLLYADQYSSHADAHQFLSTLRRTVKAVYFWLLPEEDSNIVDRCVGPMFSVSFLPEVLYELIKQVCWERRLRSPRLESIFQVTKKLLNTLAVRQDQDLTRVVYSPLSAIDESRGLGAWLWDDDDTCTWSSFDDVGPSQTLAEWIPFLDNFILDVDTHVDHTSSSY
ncbi:hypothetical protein C0993_000486 [Termitomyces sp. T159_Od127]|nr:hypothetical protein C0993_000486 [Termitomyces sp. T159_Od127]